MPAKVESKPTFDLEARERIRTALNAYMDQHGIGVPTLRVRIAEATGRTVDNVPLRTLQRFIRPRATASTGELEGKIQEDQEPKEGTINDSAIVPYAAFVATLPTVNAISHLGRGLSAFFNFSIIDQFEGVYVARSPLQVSTIEVSNGGEFWLVKERLSGQPVIYDGALSSFDKQVVIVLRDRLTEEPRFYFIEKFGRKRRPKGVIGRTGSAFDGIVVLSDRSKHDVWIEAQL